MLRVQVPSPIPLESTQSPKIWIRVSLAYTVYLKYYITGADSLWRPSASPPSTRKCELITRRDLQRLQASRITKKRVTPRWRLFVPHRTTAAFADFRTRTSDLSHASLFIFIFFVGLSYILGVYTLHHG